MDLIPISAGSFHCDGGALFGVIPKVLWRKAYPPEKDNFTPLALRCLLIDQGDRKILIETGIGNHYSEKHLKNNGYIPGDYLLNSLTEKGYSPEAITDVLFTHLHWDHATGAVKNSGGALSLLFPGATHWCSKIQWDHSRISNPREQAAYHMEILDFLFDSKKLKFVETEGPILPGIEVRFFNGHTPGQMIPFIHSDGNTVVYTSDLIPTSAHIPLLWLAAYDLNPVTVMEEKEAFLKEAADKDYILFFEHDYYVHSARVEEGAKGFRIKQLDPLK